MSDDNPWFYVGGVGGIVVAAWLYRLYLNRKHRRS
jgi:hypothetical protein